jgi:hypothetical protein
VSGTEDGLVDGHPDIPVSSSTPTRMDRVRNARYGAIESAKARIRVVLKARELRNPVIREGLRTARYVAVLIVKDEAPRFPFLLKYYRELGIEHFLVIDNRSTDGLSEFLKNEDDVSTYFADGAFGNARYGIDWVNLALHRHCRDKWVLMIDADEFLVVPGASTVMQVSDALEEAGKRSLQAMMLDMYSYRKTDENKVPAGVDPLEVCSLYDSTGYYSRWDARSNVTWTKGGVRGRLFFPDAIWSGPALNKTPLLRWKRGDYFIKAAHQLVPRSVNGGNVLPQGVLLHFKFTVEGASKVIDPTVKSQHTEEYEAYSAVADSEFVGDQTVAYRGPQALVDEGILETLS